MSKFKEDNKIILFPGMIERNIQLAVEAAENMRYLEAIEILEDILAYVDGDEYILSIYIHCLYETKDYELAKSACEELIALQPENYFDVMELYLTICMQLKQFLQVEKIIQTLFDQNMIPKEKVENFKRIQALNDDIATNKQKIEMQENYNEIFDFSASEFLAQSDMQQLVQIQQLSTLNIRPFVQELNKVIQESEAHPFIKSLVLVLLVEQQINTNVMISKFGKEQSFQTATLNLPTMLPQYQQIEQLLVNEYENDPTKMELVLQLLAKHAIVCYPFEWHPYRAKEVAEAYYQYVEEMFGNVENEKTDAFQFIELLEKLSELQ